MEETVSVIIPTWNRAALIEKAVRSALNQTIPVLEVLVCDDGSTDRTEEIISSIDDDRIRFIQGPRGGRPAIPRNRGIRSCTGDWIAFLDSDDEWVSEKLEKQIHLAHKLGCRAVCSNAHHFVPERGVVGTFLGFASERLTFDGLLAVNQIICSSAVVHRSVLAVTGGFPEESRLKVGEDYSAWLRVCTQTDFAFVREPLLVYLDDSKNSVRSDLADERMSRFFALTNFAAWARANKVSYSYCTKAVIQAAQDLAASKTAIVLKPLKKLKRLALKR